MAQSMGSYDESLLRDAPVATRRQLQEGYTTDLLASPTKHINRTQSPLPDGATATIPPTALRNDLEQGQRSQEAFNHYTPLNEKVIPPNRTTPFFRTTKGIIVIAALVIIVIGAVVGAAVGTSVHKSTNNNSALSTTSLAGPTPTTSTVSSTATGDGSGVSPGNGGNPLSGITVGLSVTATTTPNRFGPTPAPDGPGEILQSPSNAIAAMKQMGHHQRRHVDSSYDILSEQENHL